MSHNDCKPILIVFQGSKSQTGIAFKSEFPDISFEESNLSFNDIYEDFKTKSLIAVLPIWNSHAGEITISHGLSMIFNEQALLYHLWPTRIIFECLFRPGLVGNKKLISVKVAEQQCSKFLNNNNYEFHDGGSSIQAYEKFTSDKNIQAVLCAPGVNKEGHQVLTEDAANPINFTTFGLLGSYDSQNWGANKWEEFYKKISPKCQIYSAIQMPASSSFSDSQEELFDSFIEDAMSIEDIPKILFVARHENSKCRLLIQGITEIVPEIISESGADEEIKIIPNVGTTKEEYSKNAYALLETMIDFSEHDFIKHDGENTCFFACPALGIITHGFENEITELVVRRLIKKHFELLSKLEKSESQTKEEIIFKKYEAQFKKSSTDFFEFTPIGI